MINVYSPTETNFKNNGLATLIPISCDLDVGINGKWQLTMEHPFDKELRYQHLVEDAILRVTGISCVNEQEQDTDRFGLNGKVQLFRVFDTKKTLTSVTVIAFPVALEAVYDTPIENLIIQNKTGIQAGEILDAQTQKYSISSDITRTASSKYENTNLIASISGDNDDSYVKKWGGEVVYDNYKIKIRNKIGDQSNASAYPIRYGRNLTGLSHEIDMSSVVTRIFPISSDDLRLNVWEDVTSQGGNRYVDSSDHIGDYPFIRCLFVQVDYSLLDTDSKSISETATATNGWREGIINAVTAQATALWTSIIQDLTNAYSPEYIQDLISGEDGIVGYLQKKYVYSHKGWQSFIKSCVKQGVEWIKSEELPIWEWHEDTSVTPHAWWYGDNSVTPAVSYAKNEYVNIGKNYEYFNNDGFWEDYKAMPQDDCDWYEAKDGSGKKWYGYRKGYYAHNEYVYMTVEGQMKEWWYDEEGWYDESRSGDSDMGWHGDATSGYWFGEEDATSEDTNKFLHDRWAWIDGNYYWFDQYGYISGELDKPDYPWFIIETTQGSWFGNDEDEMLGAKWFANQWAEIDGEWYYFDTDGYVVDMTAKQSETIAWFANTVYNNTIEYITGCLTNAYTLLYRLMTEWCEKQYADGIDLPTVNVSVDLIDLSKTTEYKDYSNLEQISLGDKVLVIGRDGSKYEERVVGLTYDCIRGYNTRVEVGQLSKSVSQIINVSYSGASEGQKIIAGDGVTIDGKVISVGDYVGRTIGLQDVLLNGSTTVSGNVSSFGIQAGENISITRDGNILTISSEGNTVYAGTSTPSASLGEEDDLYLQTANYAGDIVGDVKETGGGIVSYSSTRQAYNIFDFEQQLYPDFDWDHISYNLNGLVDGRTYTVAFTQQFTNATFQGGYTDAIYVDTLGGTDGTAELYADNDSHDFSFSFVAGLENTLIFSYPNCSNRRNITSTITNLTISGTFGNDIVEIYGKIDGRWTKYVGDGTTYEAGANIQIENGVISATDTTYSPFSGATSQTDGSAGLVPAPTINDVDKVLGANGQWVPQTGGSEVEANPSGTATDTLQKIDIDGTIYDLAAGSSNLSDLSDVNISTPTNGQILKYDSNLGKWINATGGGGGGGSSFSETVLFENTTTSIPSQITLSDNYTNYDLLYFYIIRRADNRFYEMGRMLDVSQMEIDDYIQFLVYVNEYMSYKVTNANTLDRINYGGNAYIYRIVGLKMGGGGGGSSTLSGLTDVDITSPSNGQALIFDAPNNKWVNGNGGGGTNVVANPSGQETATLIKLQVGNTIYGVSGDGGNGIFSKSVIQSQNITAEFEYKYALLESFVSGVSFTPPLGNHSIGRIGYIPTVDLGSVNESCTIYAVIKSDDGTNTDNTLIGCNYELSSGNTPNIFTRNGQLWLSVYGSDTNTRVSSLDYHVITLAIDTTAKKARYYIDGVAYGGEKSFNNSGRYVSFGGLWVSNTSIKQALCQLIYGAVVSGAESESDIVANHALLMTEYASYIGD